MTGADPQGVRARAWVRAPAKVNLSLRVLERRTDGYHELETCFQAVDLCDEVEVQRVEGDGVTLEVVGADVGSLDDNLVMQAARAFVAAAGRRRAGFHITLTKRIPAGAGLGGGSSDAGATLRALDHLLPGTVPPARLGEIGAALGSDVPFFTQPHGRMLGRGRGERMTPLSPLPPAWLLLGLPPVHVATGEAYRALARARADGGRPAAARHPSAPRAGADGAPPDDWEAAAAAAVNDFEGVIAGAHPEIARTLAALRDRHPRFALLSGSGAAAFGVYLDAREARAALAGADAACPASRFVIARTLDRLPEVESHHP